MLDRDIESRPVHRSATLLSLLGLFAAPAVFGHNVEARYIEPLSWHLNHFSKVMAMSYSELGLDFDYSHAAMQTVQGRTCAVGGAAAGPGPSPGTGMRPGTLVALQVDRRYAYNIDEPVTLTLTYAPALTDGPLVIAWDKNGGLGQGRVEVEPEPGAPFRTISVTLDRAAPCRRSARPAAPASRAAALFRSNRKCRHAPVSAILSQWRRAAD